MNAQLNITPDTKIGDLLDNFPFLENELIKIAPAFSKLKNPVLRKTIAKVTSIKQAAVVGNVSLSEMVNQLRKAAGLNEMNSNIENQNDENVNFEIEKPDFIYDAHIDLENGIHPVGKVISALTKLNSGEVYLLITPFVPAPLIEKAKEKGVKAFSKETGDKVETYFKKD